MSTHQLPLMLLLLLMLHSSMVATTTDTGTKAGTGYSAQLRVLSNDGTVSVSVDGSSGLITSIVTRGVKHQVTAGSTMEGLITLQVVVRKLANSVIVERTVCVKASDVPCTMTQALLTETFEPRLSSVGWVLNASSPSTPSVPVPLWTRALQTNVTYSHLLMQPTSSCGFPGSEVATRSAALGANSSMRCCHRMVAQCLSQI